MRSLILEPYPNLREIHIGEDVSLYEDPCRPFFVKSDVLQSLLYQRYGRDGLCLRVYPFGVEADEDIPLAFNAIESTKVRNLLAWKRPMWRVYDLVTVNDKYLAQVVNDYDFERSIARIAIDEHIGVSLSGLDYFRFNGSIDYQSSLAVRGCVDGHSKPQQAIPELDMEGIRPESIEYRVEALKFDEVNFTGKSVLDVGCSTGAFCREAVERGARRIVGIDNEAAKAAYEISNWLGYWNIDYVDAKLPEGYPAVESRTGLGRFDIVLLLVVAGKIGGFTDSLLNLIGDTVIFEGRRGAREEHEEELRVHFSSVEFLGCSKDWREERPVFRCRGVR